MKSILVPIFFLATVPAWSQADAKAIEMAHAYLHDTALSLYPSLSH